MGLAGCHDLGVRADALLEEGDLEGVSVWRRILRAVEELQRAEPGVAVH